MAMATTTAPLRESMLSSSGRHRGFVDIPRGPARRMIRLMASTSSAIAVGLLALFSAGSLSSSALGARAAAGKKPTTSDTDQVVQELCGKTVALLGESPMHGFGKTLQFKVEVARRLIDECHYRAFFIESGIYDFLDIQKKLESGGQVTQPMIAAAIGGLWATREVEPLVPFLLEKAQRGAVLLGGLDDQLARGTYAQQEMPAHLVEYLQGDARTQCLSILQKYTLWQYSNDAPYGPRDKILILGCLDRIETSLSNIQRHDAPFREYDLAMIESLKRNFSRDFREDVPTARDQSMYLNFQWLMSRLPPRSKVIVWAATTHVAKDLSGVPGQDHMVPMGSYIRREFTDHSFVLGFSAYSGTYGMARQPVRQLSVAPPLSLEGQAFAKDDSATRYFTLNQLRKFGAVPARPTGPDFRTAKWDEVLDGLVVFREEHPPEFPNSGRSSASKPARYSSYYIP
jgi:erythromycin esterase-like protein